MHFPVNCKSSKIFNKTTVKLSYSCLPSMNNFINAHKQEILNTKNTTSKALNITTATNIVVSRLIWNVYLKESRKRHYAVIKGTKNIFVQQTTLLREDIISINTPRTTLNARRL